MENQPQIYTDLRVKSHESALTEIWSWFEKWTQLILSEDLQWQCRLALTEAFTNVVNHAHQNLPETTPIDIELELDQDLLRLRIWDYGQPFDLEQTLTDILNQKGNYLLEENGRGLLLMSQLMDELHYQRNPDNRNFLLMIKTLKNPS